MRVYLAIGLLALMLALSGCRDKGDKEPTVAPTPSQQQNFQPAQKQEEKQQSAATPFQSPVSPGAPVSPLPTPQ